jgi:uncharacterized protein DUF6527
MLHKAAACIARLWTTVPWKVQGWRRPAVVAVLVDGEPLRLRRNIMYVRESAGGPAFGYLACPCGCGTTLHLRFIGERRPRWSLSIDVEGRVTVHPSVWRGTGCGSHFFVRRGCIEWR